MKADGPTFHHYASERLNRYTCQRCGSSVVTVDTDDGTTPFMLGCRATKGCSGTMQSSLYRVSGRPDPQFEWRKPSVSEYLSASEAMKQHFDMGGLDIYPLESREEGSSK